MLSFFILFDNTQTEFNEIFTEKVTSARTALNLFYKASEAVRRNNLEDIICSARFYLYQREF
jgi:hypothetical protein